MNTLAGSGVQSVTDGTGTSASLYAPAGIVSSTDGSELYICDEFRVRKLVLTGEIFLIIFFCQCTYYYYI